MNQFDVIPIIGDQFVCDEAWLDTKNHLIIPKYSHGTVSRITEQYVTLHLSHHAVYKFEYVNSWETSVKWSEELNFSLEEIKVLFKPKSGDFNTFLNHVLETAEEGLFEELYFFPQKTSAFELRYADMSYCGLCGQRNSSFDFHKAYCSSF